MKLHKLIGAVALMAGSLVMGTQAIAGDKLRIATEGAYAPFNMVNAQGELEGFDVDIARALCAEMKADCEIVAQDWDGIIPGLRARKYDAIVASMSITKERQRVVEFTERYYSNVLAFVAPKGQAADTSEAGLKGIRNCCGISQLSHVFAPVDFGDSSRAKGACLPDGIQVY